MSLMIVIRKFKNYFMKNTLLLLSILLGAIDCYFAQVKVPEWTKNATIYEVNIRQFTPEGTFVAFQKHLPRLKEMGVDILLLMPIHPIGELNRKGRLGNCYAVRDYKGANPEFGSIDDFRMLIKEAHRQGFKIIIDWVTNHASPDNTWVDQGHKDWFNLDSLGNPQAPIGGEWEDVAELNFDNKAMRIAMIDAMKYWVSEVDVDGFRCDAAVWPSMNVVWPSMDFWKQTRNELYKIKPVIMLADAEAPLLHNAFDMTSAREFNQLMYGIVQGEKNSSDLRKYLEDEKKYPLGSIRMQYTTNHVENSWFGTEKEGFGDARCVLAVLSATFQGMPLVYNGQEASLDKRLRLYDKDTIDWSKMDLVPFYTKLLKLHQTNQALWNGPFGGEVQFVSDTNITNVFAYIRIKNNQKVLCVLNTSNSKKSIELNGEQVIGKYSDLFSSKKKKIKNGTRIKLGAWGYRVYYL